MNEFFITLIINIKIIVFFRTIQKRNSNGHRAVFLKAL